jgi:hypothetical protein
MSNLHPVQFDASLTGKKTARSDYWYEIFQNALNKGATVEQAERLADATVKTWR